jgi:hypothetical protein
VLTQSDTRVSDAKQYIVEDRTPLRTLLCDAALSARAGVRRDVQRTWKANRLRPRNRLKPDARPINYAGRTKHNVRIVRRARYATTKRSTNAPQIRSSEDE